MNVGRAGRLSLGILRRARRLVFPAPPPPAQLEMIWPEERLHEVPLVEIPPGFRLRTYQPSDEVAYFELLGRASLRPYPLQAWSTFLLPDGFFVIEEESSGKLVATCFAAHHPTPRHPFAGQLGWLAADRDYAGRGLGYTATAAVTRRLISAGYRRIYLTTDDFRLAAIKIYLKMGWVPLLYQEDMAGRWKAVCEKLGLPFDCGNATDEEQR
jgi:mycothiol synthase